MKFSCIKIFQPKCNQNEEQNWSQVLAILTACLSPLTLGFIVAWTSPSIPKLINDHVNYNITEKEASLLPVVAPIGTIISSPIFFKLSDSIGRKRTFLISGFLFVIFWIIVAFAKSIYLFHLAKILASVADACIYAVLPMYIGEVAIPKVRGTWGSASTCSVYLGFLIVNVVGSYLSIRLTALILLIIPTIFIIGMSFMPETPYFHLMKDREDDARESLRFLRRKFDVEEELKEIKAAVRRQMSEPSSWKDLVLLQTNRRALYASIFLRISQQFGGIAAFITFNQTIFAKAGGNISPEISSTIFFALLFGLNFCAGFFLDHLGRRKSFLVSMISCAVFLFIESIYFYLDSLQRLNTLNWNWIPLAGLVGFSAAYSMGSASVPTMMLGELFSASIKAKALCFMNIVFSLCLLFSTYIFSLLLTYVGLYGPFLLFGICSTISGILTLYIVPETQGKTLEQIQQSLK